MEKVKLLGHIVDDGEQQWLISSAAEVGFKVTGATRVLLKLRADDSVLDPGKEPLLPRFEIRLDGKKILDARLTVKDAAVTVFEGDVKRDAEVRLIKLNEGNSLFALREILTDGKVEPLPGRPLKMENWKKNIHAIKYYARVRPKKIPEMLKKAMKLTNAEVEEYFGKTLKLLEETNKRPES